MNAIQSHEVVIIAHSQPEILERILRVIRHRGFRISALNMAQMNDCNNIKITVTVFGECTIDLLYKQLDKLFDVVSVMYLCIEKR